MLENSLTFWFGQLCRYLSKFIFKTCFNCGTLTFGSLSQNVKNAVPMLSQSMVEFTVFKIVVWGTHKQEGPFLPLCCTPNTSTRVWSRPLPWGCLGISDHTQALAPPWCFVTRHLKPQCEMGSFLGTFPKTLCLHFSSSSLCFVLFLLQN